MGTQILRLADTDKEMPQAVTNGFLRYNKFRPLAEGGAGKLEICYDKNLGRDVVMKRMLAGSAADPEETTRFLREARVSAALEHPNVISVYEISRDNMRSLYFTMKRIEGEDLSSILKRLAAGDEDYQESYPRRRLLDIYRQVCNGIAYAHSCGVVHRDLKPANVMVGPYDEVVVLDWGLAKVEGTRACQDPAEEGFFVEGLTMPGSLIGTPLYMPPEQACGGTIDERTDVYSLGAILFEILTLKTIFQGRSKEDVYEKINAGEAPPPSQAAPDAGIPEALDDVCLKAIEHSPAYRHQTVEALRDEIHDFLLSGAAREDS